LSEKWVVKLEVEVTAKNVKEAREKALGMFWNINRVDKLRLLEFAKLDEGES